MSQTLKSGQLNLTNVPDHKGKNICPGDRVLILGNHPHAGKIGVYKGVEHVPVLGKWGCLVRFDDETGCYVFGSSHWRKVD